MGLESIKLIGGGAAAISLSGAGVGIGIVFAGLMLAYSRNPYLLKAVIYLCNFRFCINRSYCIIWINGYFFNFICFLRKNYIKY